ncbi:MAG TPA: serine hydrolase, partial [Chloroflexota bacterium]|nr:serine hydrolase [Chloroflexota bacterium]
MPKMNDALLADAIAYAGPWIAHQQRTKEIPAVTVAIRHDDDLLLSDAYGHADLERDEPATTASIFRVASHSKWFT